MKKNLLKDFLLTVVFLATGTPILQAVPDKFAGIERYADGMFETLLRENNIAGATFSMAQDGAIRYSKGYGYANVSHNIKVDPDSTLFRIASISKLFVWIGVMQMVEQGKLDLDRNINEYLQAFKIPDTYPEPVTLRSLMTHTPGFEDRIAMFVREPSDMQPLEEVLKAQLPKRVRPPFIQASYSNHATAIAQHLIELVSGMPFAEYAERYIFSPLGMHNTTLLQPLPADMALNLSNGYSFSAGRFRLQLFEFDPLQSAGGASTTAKDMARFIKALLNNSCLNGQCLMDSATFRKMYQPAFFHSPNVNPALLGFIDMSTNNRQIIGHGGALTSFHSMLAVFPGENTGFFYSFNTSGAGRLTRRILQHLTDKFFPDTVPLSQTIELAPEFLERFVGTYRANRFSHTQLFKIFSIENVAQVNIENDTMRLDIGGETTRWVPTDSLIFRNIHNNSTIAFSVDEKGKIQNLFIGNRPTIAFNRNYGVWNWQWHRALLIVLIIVLFYILVVWPWMYIVRHKYVRADRAPDTLPLLSKWMAWLASACFLTFGILVYFSLPQANEQIFEVPRGIEIALAFPIIAIPFIIGMLWQSITLIAAHNTRLRSRIFYWVATLVFAATIVALNFWNLLGWSY